MVLTDGYRLLACNAMSSGRNKPMSCTELIIPVFRGEKMVQITLKY